MRLNRSRNVGHAGGLAGLAHSWRLAGLAALVAVWPAWAGASEGPLYRAHGARGTLYLLGSIHVGEAAFYPLSERVYTALDEASVLLVEVDIDRLDPAEAAQVMAMMVLPAGEQLQARLGDALWTRLSRVATGLGMPPASLQALRPWTAAVLLAVMPYTKAGLDQAHGVDKHMLAAARERSIPIGELESAMDQLGAFDQLDAAEEDRLVGITLDQLESGEADTMVRELVAAWRAGDEAGIEEALNASLRKHAPELARRLLDARNANMLTNALSALDASGAGVLMVVVGAAHLTGSNGLVELLRHEGFELEKL